MTRIFIFFKFVKFVKNRPTALVYRCAAPLSSGIDVFANEVHSLSSWGLVPSQVTKSWHFGLGGLWAVPERGAGSRESGSPEGMMSPSRQSTFEPLSHYVYLRSLTHSGIVLLNPSATTSVV